MSYLSLRLYTISFSQSQARNRCSTSVSLELHQIQIFCNCCEIYLFHNTLTGRILPTGNLKTRRQPASLLKMGPVWEGIGTFWLRLHTSYAGVQVRSLVGELRSGRQHSSAKREKNKKHGPVHNYMEHDSFRINSVICTFYKNKSKNDI